MSPQSLAADPPSERAVDIVRSLAADIWRSRDQASSPSDRRQLLSGAIEARTDVDLLSRLVLGRHWRSLGSDDRDDYRALFSRVVIRGLAGRLDILLDELDGPLEERFSIKSSGVVGKKDILVRSMVIAAAGRPLSGVWRLREVESDPVIIDLIVEGISLLVSQRAEFAAVIERGQIDGLMAMLRQRAETGAPD